MNYYTVVHVASRLIFYYLYVSTKTRPRSYLRTLIFQVSIYPAVAIFFNAARILV